MGRLALLLGASLLVARPAAADPGLSDLTFAVAIAQGVQSYSQPGVGKAFTLAVLQPYQVLGTSSAGGVEYVQVKDPAGSGAGWVDTRLLETWNSRYALKAKRGGTNKLFGYCSEAEMQAAVDGTKVERCVSFDPQALRDMTAARAPFPVLDIQERFDSDGLQTLTMEVLVPTLYSNVAGLKQGSGAVDPSRILEIIILIDATGSMEAEIKATAEALKTVVKDAEALSSDVRFLVVAYRDVDEAEDFEGCAVVEASSGATLSFGTAADANTFLSGLKATCGGENPAEALWDALYLLKDLKTTGAASRALLVVGDAPAHPATRGGTWLGTTVPPGLAQQDVFAAVANTLGQSTVFIPTVVATSTATQKNLSLGESMAALFAGVQFNMPTLDIVSIARQRNRTPAQRREDVASTVKRLSERLGKAISEHASDADRIDGCRERFAEGFGNAAIAIFCMESGTGAADPALAARIRDLLGDDDSERIVVRRIWVMWDQTLMGDVLLLGRNEADALRGTLVELSEMTASGDCSVVGPRAWYQVMGTLVPIDVSTGDMPALGQAITEHLGISMNVARGKTVVLHRTPDELRSLKKAACRQLGEDLGKSAANISAALDNEPGAAHVWLPVGVLP